MLHVYLDQAKWVDLTKHRVGRPDGARYADAYTIAEEAVARGTVSFPLSAAHYFETHHRQAWMSRLDLATTMARISRFHAIAPPHDIVPAEIIEALGGPPLRRTTRVFGVGVRHVFGLDIPLDLMQLPDDVEVAPAERAELAHGFVQMMEFAILANPQLTADMESVSLEASRKTMDADEKFADGQAALADNLDTHKLRGRLDDVMTASEMVDIIEPLVRACQRLGIDVEAFVGDRGRVQHFLENVPSRWVTRELRRVRHRNRQQQWQRGDLNDVNALSVATPYCDVVVTERQWARHLNQEGLAEKYGTVVIHDLTELPSLLAAAPTT